VGHPDAIAKLPTSAQKRVAFTGNPIRKEILHPAPEGGHTFLSLDPTIPTVFIMGGSQGAQKINETVLDALADLVTRYNVVHQTGAQNLIEVKGIASVILKKNKYEDRYKAFGLLNTLALRMAAGISSVVVARAGSGTIAEIASWGIPAILIPIPRDVSHDQTENAFAYARAGASSVVEQYNLTPHVLSAEIDRIVGDTTLQEKMKKGAASYAHPEAARTIAQILLEAVISHQPV
jgi:UDP-N-acetylglucosamine--N-acetylmuramyl-(pentapeptide) pyrophosphoryl-undecaprenol N-acetylglucosamine transferase